MKEKSDTSQKKDEQRHAGGKAYYDRKKHSRPMNQGSKSMQLQLQIYLQMNGRRALIVLLPARHFHFLTEEVPIQHFCIKIYI